MPAWSQIFIQAPEGNGYTIPQAMKRIDDHIRQYGAMMKSSKELPVQETDGTWEVHVPDTNLLVVKGVLIKHYALEIVREVSHT